ncbi:MAG: MgtC/SapB family protein [Bacteroidia bacterium]|nr:MgtC/SapB family protein [Bacteroidia bacterium]
MDFTNEDIYSNCLKLLVALFLGSLMGAEREYKSRNIGFRTIILITLGSALFTILSLNFSNGSDPGRIASNIVTGVGFLGAGAIFREGANVKGVTTAAIIWISAAVGMACGIGQYEFASLVTLFVLVVLIGFTGIQRFIDNYNKEIVYRITMPNIIGMRAEIEKDIMECGLKYFWIKQEKQNDTLIINYEIRGSEKNHEKLLNHLAATPTIKHFEI